MIGTSIILAAAICGQDHILETRTRGNPWKHITGVPPEVKERRRRQHAAMHAAAEKNRKDLEEALRILNSTPLPLCPCFNRPGAKGFE